MNNEDSLTDFFVQVLRNFADGHESRKLFVIKRSHVPFILFDSIVSPSFPIAQSSDVSTILYGYAGASVSSISSIHRMFRSIKSLVMRPLLGEVQVVEALFTLQGGNDKEISGKMRLLFISRAVIPCSSDIQETLRRHSADLHRFAHDEKAELFFMSLSRVLYCCA